MSFEYQRFGDLFSEPQRNGLTKPKRVRGSGYPMVNMGELFAYPRIKNIPMDLVPLSEAEKNYFLKNNDLLFARQSLVLEGAGQCSIFLGNHCPTVFESHLIRCRLDHLRANPCFYFYYFQSEEGKALIRSIVEQGAGASGIRGSDLVELQVPVPPMDFQNKASYIFETYDRRIEVHKNSTIALEETLQLLFKASFNPNGENSGNKTQSSLLDIASFQNGYAFKSRDWVDSGHPVVKIGNVKPGIIDFSGCSYVDQKTVQGLDRFELKRGDLLLGMTGYVGESGLVPTVSPSAYLNQRVGRVSPLRPELRSFLYCCIRQPGYKRYAELHGRGSAQANISGEDLMSFPISMPPKDSLLQFNKMADTIIEKILLNYDQIDVLSALRKAMLSRSLNGNFDLSMIFFDENVYS